MSECRENHITVDGSETISIPINISNAVMQDAIEAWIAGDETASLRDHLLDRVEIRPVFIADGKQIE